MKRTLALPLLILAPAFAHAEGARMELVCTSDDGASLTFLFAPVDLDDLGAGRIEVGEAASRGYAGGAFGPWSWIHDDVAHTLIVDGNATDDGVPMLLHSLDTNTTPYTATRTELTCEAPT
ncbi:hypothetical protein [Maritimibacter dapengensis]|uniref:Uncharacterized protein n=1 Tax=Maritimibacter dapengensis TaxID=2836868 RepID=A0ABS6T4R2_9RHOB|nr:hypothetical protein [Maritimibacter dapengensis]MBV7379352.1 hypothetical protein [Maritimibacter dapengensis]